MLAAEAADRLLTGAAPTGRAGLRRSALWPALGGDVSAVNNQFAADHVGRIVARQKCDGTGDLGWFSQPAERDRLRGGFRKLRRRVPEARECVVDELGVGIPGMN